MTEHLERVTDICRELGLEPMIWSDMYLRMNSPASEYYDVPLDTDLSGAVKPPKEIGLVYWDYYHADEEFYKAYLHMHRQLSDKVVFAGGGWVWNGLAPNFRVAFSTTEAAMRACKAEGVREAVCTMWQDDGAETPMAAGLPSIVLFAEHGFSEQPDREQLKEQFEFLTGSSYDAYLALGEFDAVPGSREYDNPSKYLFIRISCWGCLTGRQQWLKRRWKTARPKTGMGHPGGITWILIMICFGRSCRILREAKRLWRMRYWSFISIWRMCFLLRRVSVTGCVQLIKRRIWLG